MKKNIVIIVMVIMMTVMAFIIIDLDRKYNNTKAELNLYNVVYEELDETYDIVRMKPLLFNRDNGRYISTMVNEKIEFPLKPEINEIKYVLY